MYEPNKFFLRRDEGPQHGGVRVNLMTHVPRSLSVDDAYTLAADLIKVAGGLEGFKDYAVQAGLIPAEPEMPTLPAVVETPPAPPATPAGGSGDAK